MKYVTSMLAVICLSVGWGHAADTNRTSGAEGFVRQVVLCLIEGEAKIPFPVADKVFAIDNGEVLSKADLQEAWPQFIKDAFKTNEGKWILIGIGG